MVPFGFMGKAKLQRTFIWKVHVPSNTHVGCVSRVRPTFRQHREELKIPLISEKLPVVALALFMWSLPGSLPRWVNRVVVDGTVCFPGARNSERKETGERPAEKAVSALAFNAHVTLGLY